MQPTTTCALSSLALTALLSFAAATPLTARQVTGTPITCQQPPGYSIPGYTSVLDYCQTVYGYKYPIACNLDNTVKAGFGDCTKYCTCTTPTTPVNPQKSPSDSDADAGPEPDGPPLNCPALTLEDYGVTDDVQGGLNQSLTDWCTGGVVNGACSVATQSQISQFVGSDSENVCKATCTCGS